MHDYRSLIEGYDPQTTKEIVAFLDRVDPSGLNDKARLVAFRALKGQIVTEETYQAYADAHDGKRLEQGQRPPFAYSGGSHPDGHESFFVGNNLVGKTLVHRDPNAEIIGSGGKLKPSFQAFAALANMKDIEHLIHVRNDNSILTEIAYAYNKAGGDNAAFRSLLAKNKKSLRGISPKKLRTVLVKYAESKVDIYRAVEQNGLSFYEQRGISFAACANEDEKFKLAMTAEQIRRDQKIYDADTEIGPKPEMAACVQSGFTHTHYFYSKEKDAFVEIVAQNGMSADHKAAPILGENGTKIWDAKVNQAKMRKYLDAMPDGDAWQNLAYALTIGYTRYLEQVDTPKEILLAVRACTDSRTPPRAILGYGTKDGYAFYVSRSPGNPMTDNKLDLTQEAELFVAVAELMGIDVVNTAHTECGAMTAATNQNKQNALPACERTLKLPQPFVGYAKFCEFTFDQVKGAGDSEAERAAYYTKLTGAPITNDQDALSMQQFLNDRLGVELREDADHFHHVLHHTGEGRLYMMAPRQSDNEIKFELLKVPTVKGLSPSYDPRKAMMPTRAPEAISAPCA